MFLNSEQLSPASGPLSQVLLEGVTGGNLPKTTTTSAPATTTEDDSDYPEANSGDDGNTE